MNPSHITSEEIPKDGFVSKFKRRREELGSVLCIGLDPEFEKLPEICQKSDRPLFEFCKAIVSSTSSYAVAWKPNLAFFERFGGKGLLEFEAYVRYAKEVSPDIPIIADAKRGDLANTAKEYAKYYFEFLGVDALTVSPYMGKDSLTPYVDLGGTIFVLGLTSNPSSVDFQKQKLSQNNRYLYEEVAIQMEDLGRSYPGQVGLVVGGTHPEELSNLRKLLPDLYFLIPGFGAQGGDLKSILSASGKNSVVNSSRGITLSSISSEFGSIAKEKAKLVHKAMNEEFSSLV
ncbi:MAG: orotidine-5'-phosphate decarboxylase [Leptospira sp.]|nr:orotidine-5'-phosphate decarboxylase [Leptospira sp.]